MDKVEFYNKTLDEAARDLLSIPILNEIEKISKVKLHYLFSQIYYFVDSFPALMGILLSKTSNRQIQSVVIENIVDEYGGIAKIQARDYSHAHSSLLIKFIQAIDASLVSPTKQKPYTQKLIEDFKRFFIEQTSVEVLSALAAMEGFSPQWFNLIYRQIKNRREFTSEDLYFFELHTTLDEVHGDMLKQVILPLLKDDDALHLFSKGIKHALSIWQDFYAALSQDLVGQ